MKRPPTILAARLIFFYALALLFLFPLKTISAQEIWTKHPSNPVFSEDTGNWDSYHVHNPTVILNNNIYKMWYEANGGQGWRIGYASSEDGLSGWIRSSFAVVTPHSIDGWEKETAEPIVQYFPNAQTYKMWFTSVNTNSWMVGPDRFRTRYATSPNETSWIINSDWTLSGMPGSWDGGGTYKSRSLIYRDGVYHLWYAGTDESNLTVAPFWRIGYATSPDGLTWTKQNNGDPVLTPTEPWELGNVSFPTVIWENGAYHMWYATGALDNPTKILYAYSTDGISWIKPADLNPVLTGTPGGFDESIITVSTVLKDGDQLKMWYSGFDGTHWRIGYATANASILPTPASTPTPTPTPEPTATPTPELTPTPLLPRIDTVVVIPGVLGSWNGDALLNCKLDNYSGTWTSWLGADAMYDPLLQALPQQGYTTIPFYYDWRKPIITNAPQLKTLISSLHKDKVNIVGHSMGGLVARAYLEQEQTNNKADKLLTVGSPHQGAVPAYAAWSGGRIVGGLDWQIIATLLISSCKRVHGWSAVETVRNALPSTQNLLPTFDYLKNSKTGTAIPSSSMNVKNNWLPTNFWAPFFGTTVGTITGNGFTTLQGYSVKDPNKAELSKQIWTDGKPTSDINTFAGDGVVTSTSALLPGATQMTINQTHSGLVSSQEGVSQIISFLNDAQNTPSVSSAYKEPETALFVASYPSIFWVEDPTGRTLKGNDGQITYLNPKKGTYKLKAIPTSGNTLVIVGQFLKNGKTLWKEYQLKNILPKFKSIQFDPTHPLEEPLR